jgi:hypothetical protein
MTDSPKSTGGRALLDKLELAQLDQEIAKNGYLTIEQVRSLVQQNTAKYEIVGEKQTLVVDPEIILSIDTHTNYNVFISNDDVLTRENLLAQYPFEEMGNTPESVFEQQEIGTFTSKGGHIVELVTRDVGSTAEILTTAELVSRSVHTENYTHNKVKKPNQIIQTHVYIGKENWEDFTSMAKLARGVRKFASSAQLPWFFGGKENHLIES